MAITVTAGLMLLGAGGTAVAGYRYEAAHASEILPGVRIDGVDVSGLTRDEAIQAVTASAQIRLGRSLTISAGSRSWEISAQALGERADTVTAVDRALDVGGDMSVLERAWQRFRHDSVGVDVALAYEVPSLSAVRTFVDEVGRRTERAATDAAITLGDDGDVAFIEPEPGRRLAVEGAVAAIDQALRDGANAVQLRMRDVAPKVTRRTIGTTIVVRVDQNKLYLYDGFKVIRSYDVATAKPGWTTPVGVWRIWDKRENPTWYNPALDSWGADLPAVIPGGSGNPMGTRAIYIDAPGLIRIHGTTDDSSIGRYASHGCIRMHNAEVEQLFRMVDVGSTVIVAGARPSWAQEWDTPTHADI